MKFKLIQLVILLAFVMSVVFMAQTPIGFGGEPSTHQPSIWINPDRTSDLYGELETPPNVPIREPERSRYLNSLIGTDRDPRDKNFTKFICGTNGAEYFNHRAWCYRGGKVSNPKGHKENPNSRNHTSTYKQQIYTIVLETSASASASGASARLDPKIEEPESLSIESSDDPLPFQGQGKITLDSPALSYHAIMVFFYYDSPCINRKTDEYYWKPAQESEIKILVHRVNVTEKRTGSIGVGVGGSAKGAEASFTHDWKWEWGRSFWNTKGRGFGIKASIGGWWTANSSPEIKLQTKTAKVYGNVDDARHSEITASYWYKKTLCPAGSRYSGKHLHLRVAGVTNF